MLHKCCRVVDDRNTNLNEATDVDTHAINLRSFLMREAVRCFYTMERPFIHNVDLSRILKSEKNLFLFFVFLKFMVVVTVAHKGQTVTRKPP